mmetsp:Transcript_23627/g.66295  ORF Transcript_23627/g.66295 Transcript_23627/m.66295 type:complete len:206 (+) Transcript_23627:53-670(+)
MVPPPSQCCVPLAGRSGNRPSFCCCSSSSSVAICMSLASSSAPRGSAISSTQRLRSSQNMKAPFRSSLASTQHGKRDFRSLGNIAGSPVYFRKNRHTMPMHARGSMNVGSSAGVCVWSPLDGEAHMKPGGSSLTRDRSFSKIDETAASVSCRSARLRIRTREWNAARSKSTSAFHISFLSLIGTRDMTRLSRSTDLVWESTGDFG